MRSNRVRPYLDRVGRVCRVEGCGAILHDEAKFCAQCGVSTRSHGGISAWWHGVFFPARCSRCRCLILHAAHPYCRRCGKEDGANAFERDSVPRSLGVAALTFSAAWVLIGLLLTRLLIGRPSDGTASVGVIIEAGIIACTIGIGVYRWRRSVHPKPLSAEEAAMVLRMAKRRPTRQMLQQWTYEG